MRIRKRQVPLPFSSLSPLPLSDPPLNRTPVPVVQLQLNTALSPSKPSNLSHALHTHIPHRVSLLPPSDPPNQRPSPVGKQSNILDTVVDDATGTPNNDNHLEKKLQPVDEDDGDEEEEEGEGEEEKCNYTRERDIISGAEMNNGFLSESSSSLHVVGRWCESEKAFPLKKRRGSFERPRDYYNNEDEVTVNLLDNNKDKKKMMKTKMNKKCNNQNHQGEESKLGIDQINISGGGGGGKKRSRGGALMEGSRCSRVNGRGWRCCQQTLVGYSLCEHHLGKGRLRSMNSVRSRSEKESTRRQPPKSEPAVLQERNDQKKTFIIIDEDDVEKPLTLGVKKRMKLGMVKARSISSLLGQTDNRMPAVPPPPSPPMSIIDDDDEFNK